MRYGRFSALAVLSLYVSAVSTAEKYTPDWESLKQHHAAPEWFQDAKLGVYFFWGLYTVPECGGDWYPRWMYTPGINDRGQWVYDFHQKHYGPDFHYHDFINEWNIEKFNAVEWIDVFEDMGAKYNQQIYAIDQAVGMIREALKEAGVDKNTVIIYTSDNGFFCGSHGYGSKVLPYEEASRVPMIIFDPREANSGRKLRSDALTGNCDFAPTMLTLAGVPVPANMDGRDLMQVYRSPTTKIHEALPLINVWGATPTHSLSIVDGDYKYIYWWYTDEDQNMHPVEEMYQLTKDPLELENLAANPEAQPILEKMRKAYDAQLKHWVDESVDYNGYQEYGTLFDRNVAWETKAALLAAKDSKKPKSKKSKKNKKSK